MIKRVPYLDDSHRPRCKTGEKPKQRRYVEKAEHGEAGVDTYVSFRGHHRGQQAPVRLYLHQNIEPFEEGESAVAALKYLSAEEVEALLPVLLQQRSLVFVQYETPHDSETSATRPLGEMQVSCEEIGVDSKTK